MYHQRSARGGLRDAWSRGWEDAQEAARQKREDAKTGYGIVRGIRTFCICASAMWWWDFHSRTMNMDTWSGLITAAVLSIGFALAIPALAAITFPSNAADKLLQQSRTRTPGFWICVAMTLFLILYAQGMAETYWSAQVGFANSPNAAWWQSWAQVSVFIGLPSMTLALTTPSRWIAEVQQAHQVQLLEEDHRAALEKRKLQHRQDLLLAEAAYAQALGIMRKGIWQASPAQIDFVINTMRGLDQAEHATLAQMSDHLSTLTGIKQEIDLLDDGEIVHIYSDLGNRLHQLAEQQRQRSLPPRATAAEAEVVETDETPPSTRPATPAPPQGARMFEQEYQAARQQLQGVWTAATLSQVLGCSERQARTIRARWVELGWVAGSDTSGRYVWTDARAA